ncbi:MAG: hypothetical protein JWR80_9148 [Bradyrhizobium sp.]|nr:hypothetical protein [Bradyrhizobium sp.]
MTLKSRLPTVPARTAPGSRLRPKLRLMELMSLWAAARHPAPKTVHGATRAIAQLISLIGDLPVGKIKGEHLFDFRDALAGLPRDLSRAERAMSFVDLVARFEEEDDPRPGVEPATIRKKLRYIQGLVSFAYGERWIAGNDVRFIPVDGHSPMKRRPFTLEEAHDVFAQPLFVRPWSEPATIRRVSNETLRWLLILGLMTGGRLEELGQLHVADIDTEDGIVCIRIDERDAEGIGHAEKSIKSSSSQRFVPLHSRLIDVGFLRLVEKRRLAGALRLFPDLERDSFERYTRLASRRCNTVIDRVSRDRSLVFHSFRHLFKDLCRSAGILESVNDQLTGHLPVTIGARYGHGVDIQTLAHEVAKLDFEFIAWEPILRAA